MGSVGGPRTVISGLGVELAVIEAVGQANGKGSLSAVAKEELAAAEARAQGLIGPVVGAVLAGCLAKWGLENVHLDQEKPFSDESLSGALGEVLGVPVASVRNREALKDAFKRAVTLKVSQAVGYQFRDVFDKQLLREDSLRAVGVQVNQAVPGLYLQDLASKQQTIRDVGEYARLKVSDMLGINFTDLSSKQAIKEDIYAWAMPLIEQEVTGEQSGESQYYKKPLKMDRKSVKNREAQRRFREKWRGCRKYRGVKDE